MPIAKSVEDTVLGEAKAGDYADVLGIVSVIDNRSKQLGVSYQDVVAAKGQFDAYGKAMPPGVGKYRGLVDKAIQEVATKGPVHAATFYATPSAAKGLPKGLAFETKTAGHQYYSDPKGRSIATAQGYKTPDPSAMATPQGLTNVAGDPSGTLYDVTEAQAAPSLAATPGVGPTPTSRPEMGLLSDVATATPTYTPDDRGAVGFKTAAARDAFALVDPAMQASFQGLQRGLLDPSAYTVTSTAEPRGRATPSRSHVTDKAAVDMRTAGLDQKALDTLAVAGMYDKGIKSISWDHTSFDPHAHFGTTTPYGRGLQAKSDISRLSPDVQQAMRSWDAHQKGLIDDFAPMVPESIAPTPIDRAAPVGPVERGILSDVPGYGQTSYAAPVGPVERGTLGPVGPEMTDPSVTAPVGQSYNIDVAGLTAPGFTGPAAKSVSTQSIGPGGIVSQAAPTGVSYGPAGQTPAGFAELGAIGKTGRAGVAAPSFAPESILGGIAMPAVGPSFAPTTQAAPAMSFAVPDVAPVPTAKPGILGPLSPVAPTRAATGITAPAQQSRQDKSQTALGQGVRGMAGAVAGGMVGGLLGPIGGILGAYVGRSMAQGKNPFSGLSGRSGAMDFGGYAMPTQAQAQRSFQQGYSPGLGFPDAPSGNSSQGGLTSYGDAASRGGFGGQAQAAADNPGTGLF